MVIMSAEELIDMVSKNPAEIAKIANPSEAVQLASVRQDGMTLKYISNPSEVVKIAAVKQCGYAISSAALWGTPSHEVQFEAAKWFARTGDALPKDIKDLCMDLKYAHYAIFGKFPKEKEEIYKSSGFSFNCLPSFVSELEACFPRPEGLEFYAKVCRRQGWRVESTKDGLLLTVNRKKGANERIVDGKIFGGLENPNYIYRKSADSKEYQKICSVISKYIKLPVYRLLFRITNNPSHYSIVPSLDEYGSYNVFIHKSIDGWDDCADIGSP